MSTQNFLSRKFAARDAFGAIKKQELENKEKFLSEQKKELASKGFTKVKFETNSSRTKKALFEKKVLTENALKTFFGRIVKMSTPVEGMDKISDLAIAENAIEFLESLKIQSTVGQVGGRQAFQQSINTPFSSPTSFELNSGLLYQKLCDVRSAFAIKNGISVSDQTLPDNVAAIDFISIESRKDIVDQSNALKESETLFFKSVSDKIKSNVQYAINEQIEKETIQKFVEESGDLVPETNAEKAKYSLEKKNLAKDRLLGKDRNILSELFSYNRVQSDAISEEVFDESVYHLTILEAATHLGLININKKDIITKLAKATQLIAK